MSQPSGGVRVGAIRDAAAEAVKAASLRSVAEDVGMSASGLRQFLKGRSPYEATLRKLTAWYARYQLDRSEFSADAARAGMALLLEAIPQAHLARAVERLAACLREIHRDCLVKPPSWLERLGDES